MKPGQLLAVTVAIPLRGPNVFRNQCRRVADVAGPVFLRSLIGGSFRVSLSAHALPALRRSRLGLGLGLRDVRVVRPSRGPRASRACPGHPRSRAAQVVRAPGIFPPSRGPAPIPSLLGRNPDPTSRTRQGSQRFLVGCSQNSGTASPKLRAPVPALLRPWSCLILNPNA